MMKTVLIIMTGIGFTLGVVFGLLLQLPIDTLPADSPSLHSSNSDAPAGRYRRSVENPSSEHPHRVRGLQQNSDKNIQNADMNLESPNLPSQTVFKNTSIVLSPKEHSATHSGGLSILKRKLDELNRSTKPSPSNTNQITDDVHRQEQGVKAKTDTDHPSKEDVTYLSSLVKGITWSRQLEASCPAPFAPTDADAWRAHTSTLDIVKVEEGCGRMQNRLVTFRDSSKACARYRLNTDQIQGEVFSYYLARLLNVSHVPPTVLALVDSRTARWRAVHLQLSLAQWADQRLVVLTRYIPGMTPALIPTEFRGEEGSREAPGVQSFVVGDKLKNGVVGHKGALAFDGDEPQPGLPSNFKPKLTPTLSSLGTKSRPDLCQLLQWSDLIVLDYLTANLDRVINNMFNRQWNDQMMASPAHNLEQKPDGGLVFLDNESGLFHGYRLLDKYAAFHHQLLGALCVFRSSTVATIKRLRHAYTVGTELREIFAKSEPLLHDRLAPLPDKNIKILQQRIEDVYNQIQTCDKVYGGGVVSGEDFVGGVDSFSHDISSRAGQHNNNDARSGHSSSGKSRRNSRLRNQRTSHSDKNR